MIIPILPITRELTADYYELGSIVDSASARTVSASVTTVFGPLTLVLWEGDEYDAIGDWTQDEALARIETLIAERYK